MLLSAARYGSTLASTYASQLQYIVKTTDIASSVRTRRHHLQAAGCSRAFGSTCPVNARRGDGGCFSANLGMSLAGGVGGRQCRSLRREIGPKSRGHTSPLPGSVHRIVSMASGPFAEPMHHLSSFRIREHDRDGLCTRREVASLTCVTKEWRGKEFWIERD